MMLQGHTAPVMALTFNHDNTRLISGGEDKMVKLWNLENSFQSPLPLPDHQAGD